MTFTGCLWPPETLTCTRCSYPVISLGFDCTYSLAATLINTAAVATDVPVEVSVGGNATQLLVGNVRVVAQEVQHQQKWRVTATLRFTAAHQGRSFTVCFDAQCSGLPLHPAPLATKP